MDTGEKAAIGALALVGAYFYWEQKRPFAMRAGGDADYIRGKYNLPTWLTLTQAAHESNWGKSKLTVLANNLFGYTQGTWTGQTVFMPTTEYKAGKAYSTSRAFRAYPSWRASMEDWAKHLTTMKRYAGVVAAARAGDVKGTWAALQGAGYATDPKYGSKLAGVYRRVTAAV